MKRRGFLTMLGLAAPAAAFGGIALAKELLPTLENVTIKNAHIGDLQVSGSILGEQIACSEITSTKIAANAITAEKILANSVSINQLSIADFGDRIMTYQPVYR